MGVFQHKLEFSDNEGVMTMTSEDQRVIENTIYNILKKYKPGLVDDEDILDLSKVTLTRDLHQYFIDWYLTFELPAFGVGLDASRPWQMYWCTHAYVGLLGFRLRKDQRHNLVETLKRCRPLLKKGDTRTPKAGFGGGPGQIMHLAPTYAGIMALATVLKTRDEWDEIVNRRELHDWILSLKQPDGSFVMHDGGEVDVRASYCALAVAGLLNILTPEITKNSASFLAACQTYEGGFSCAAYPAFLTDIPKNPPQAEAHGGYAFCALAAYLVVSPPSKPVSLPIDVDTLYRWAAHMQALPVEGGGFRGRTNKLVDGCYSWWNGGLFQLIEPLLDGANPSTKLFDEEALQDYVLLISQCKTGGLQDKPGKANDTYHTCYALSGLSAAQHHMQFDRSLVQELETRWVASNEPFLGKDESPEEAENRERVYWTAFSAWQPSPEPSVVGDSGNLINATHPIFNIGLEHAARTLSVFYTQAPVLASEGGA